MKIKKIKWIKKRKRISKLSYYFYEGFMERVNLYVILLFYSFGRLVRVGIFLFYMERLD